MLRGVVFDFDGVVVDSHAVHLRAWRKFLESVGHVTSDDELKFVLDGRKRDDIMRHFLGSLDSRKVLEYGYQKEMIFRTEAADVQTVEGLIPFLQQLKAVPLMLAIASSGSRSRINFLLGRLNLSRPFKVIVTGDEVEKGKPDPALFLKAAQDLQIEPTELIAFEDAYSGVRAAKAAGMKCVGIAQRDRATLLLNAGADYVTPDFREVSYDRLKELFVQ